MGKSASKTKSFPWGHPLLYVNLLREHLEISCFPLSQLRWGQRGHQPLSPSMHLRNRGLAVTVGIDQ